MKKVQVSLSSYFLTDPKIEWNAAQERKAALQAQLEREGDLLPLLHPEMADLYRERVSRLVEALEHPETRSEAAEASAA